MAKVQIQVAGGDQQEKDVSTVGEARSAVGAETGWQAQINGEPAKDSDQLRKNDFITFTKPVKAG